MKDSPTIADADNLEPLWDLTPDLTIGEAALSKSASNLFQAADACKRDVRCFDFVPSNYLNAWNCLTWLAAICDSANVTNPLSNTAWFQHISQKTTTEKVQFCEWGSGLGVVAGLASLAGFDALGIELDERLSQQSRQLLGDQSIPVRIVCGSYFDHHEPADVYYVYGWPSQRSKVIDLFLQTAPTHALLLLCDGQDLLRVFTRWPHANQACYSS